MISIMCRNFNTLSLLEVCSIFFRIVDFGRRCLIIRTFDH